MSHIYDHNQISTSNNIIYGLLNHLSAQTHPHILNAGFDQTNAAELLNNNPWIINAIIDPNPIDLTNPTISYIIQHSQATNALNLNKALLQAVPQNMPQVLIDLIEEYVPYNPSMILVQWDQLKPLLQASQLYQNSVPNPVFFRLTLNCRNRNCGHEYTIPILYYMGWMYLSAAGINNQSWRLFNCIQGYDCEGTIALFIQRGYLNYNSE